MLSNRKSSFLTVLLAGIFCLLGLLAPRAGEAKVACAYDGGGMALSVTVAGFDEAEVTRFRDEILVSASIGSPIRCAGEEATITNTERIDVVAKGEGAVWISLSGGPFAPGATQEPDASSEIEFTVAGDGFVDFEGGRGQDHFRFLGSGSESGVNLNADDDDDLDVTSPSHPSPSLLLVFEGGPGADLIDAKGRPGLEMFAAGGKGDDTLVAPAAAGAILDGGKGRDRLFGGNRSDFLVPGPGADAVKARSGSDQVMIGSDRQRDRIDCGAGTDFVGKPDDMDRLLACERVKGRGSRN